MAMRDSLHWVGTWTATPAPASISRRSAATVSRRGAATLRRRRATGLGPTPRQESTGPRANDAILMVQGGEEGCDTPAAEGA